jgi:hypothetical protein
LLKTDLEKEAGDKTGAASELALVWWTRATAAAAAAAAKWVKRERETEGKTRPGELKESRDVAISDFCLNRWGKVLKN